VAEGVVVGLEAVQVEQQQGERALQRRAGEVALEIGHQAAPVAQPGERIHQGLLAAGGQQPRAVAEGHRHPQHHEAERGGGQAECHDAQAREVVVGEQAQGRDAAQERDRHDPRPLDRGLLHAV